MSTASDPGSPATGPILFAYDGSDLARLAIEEAGRQLPHGRDALVVCVWQPADLGFVPVSDRHIDAGAADQVKQLAEETAAHGARLAEEAGFRATALTIQGAPAWKGIVEIADEHDASLLVMGSHQRRGIVGHLLGSVTAAVMAHSARPILVVHQRSS